ncbi:MAG TPA: hypothetical protein ENK26_00835, partial [Gammaproteobacteria bacterium]|nr:hypothetical protein [Gammaproteobacteria bacterium]
MSDIDVLKAYFRETAPILDEAGIDALIDAIVLEKTDEGGGQRTLKGEVSPDGKTVTAESLKAFNILKVGFRELIPAFLKGGALFLTLESRVA